MNRVVIIHHHLLPGGVTQIIKSQAEFIGNTSNSGYRLSVISGTRPAGDLHDSAMKDIIVEPLINYLPPGLSSTGLQKKKKDIETVFHKHIAKDDVIHIHNLNLGKNPLLSIVIHEMAQKGYRILNHCHDFAEEGRFKNYEQLLYVIEKVYGLELQNVLYPNMPNYYWAVINQRDIKVLVKAGIPKSRIKLLMNPVVKKTIGASSGLSRKDLCGILGIKHREKIILYPVRAIRRKNLGELLLLSVLLKGEGNWIISAAPDNPQEKTNYRFWEETSSGLNLPIVFSAVDLVDYPDLVFHADEMITTSVLEGFGMGFLEPWLFGKSLFGRDIPEITADFKKLGINFPRMYSSLNVPLGYITDARGLIDDYEEYISGAFKQTGIQIPKILKKKIRDSKIKNLSVDFADLDNYRQRKLIELAAGDEKIRKNLGKILKIKSIFRQPSIQAQKQNADLIRGKMNLELYGKKLLSIYDGMNEAVFAGKIVKVKSPASAVKFFLNPSRFRLILR